MFANVRVREYQTSYIPSPNNPKKTELKLKLKLGDITISLRNRSLSTTSVELNPQRAQDVRRQCPT